MNESLVRSFSGLVYVILLIAATSYSRESFLLLFGFFLLQTVREFAALVHLSKVYSMLLAFVMYVLFGVFYVTQSITDFGLLLASLFVCVQLLFWLFSKHKATSFSISDQWVKLIGYIILPFIFMTKIPVQNQVYIPSIIIGIFVLIWTNDTFAYIVGKSIGKTKLFERISPKKTIEGFIGGVVFAIIASFIIAHYSGSLTLFSWIVIAVLVSLLGTVGDLVESKFKREAGVKDSGTIMPGHGGIYDRLDSVIFVAPFIFLFLKLITYVS